MCFLLNKETSQILIDYYQENNADNYVLLFTLDEING